MSSPVKPDVHKVKEKIERFRWENYRRDYQSDQTDIEKLYWYCLVSDIIATFKNKEEEELINKLANRLYRSYLGCFFEAHHVYHSLFDKFDGFSAYYWNEDQVRWKNWKTRLAKVRKENFSIICHMVKRNFDDREAIKTEGQDMRLDITMHDDKHTQLAQKISTILIKHLKHGDLAKREPGTTTAVFPYYIKPDFISLLDQYALTYFKASMLSVVTDRIDVQFDEGNNIISTKEYLGEDQSINDAVEDLLEKHPDLRALDDSQIAYLIRLKYLGADGKKLKLDSIKKALSRMDH